MAKMLGRLGGRARALKLSSKRRRAIASLGGHAASMGRSKVVRQKIAQEAAQARWEGVRAGKLIEENGRRFDVIQFLRENIR